MTTPEAAPVQAQNLVPDALSPGGQLPDRKGGIFVCVKRLELAEQAAPLVQGREVSFLYAGSAKLLALKAYQGDVAAAIQELFDIGIRSYLLGRDRIVSMGCLSY
ncbi:hypothetical protein QYE76_026398 [Lolium multiflorum]|uniref:Uncharacterized protein n=1 Tax=Lolium multiflorum TaxID=4521 RepID=A0AAD8RHK7_LOLMU|nr:hypothetical protein QYE76_026398 [Lolium multiflorum]